MRLKRVQKCPELGVPLLRTSLLVFIVLCQLCAAQRRQNDEYYPHPQQYHKYLYQQPDHDTRFSSPPTPADDRTFISDIIGFSAFKVMFLFAVPMIFSIFLGAMLVLLFPFPLLTSTSGLAGAAAIGRRQGRLNELDETPELLQLLGLQDNNNPTPAHAAHYYPNSDSTGDEKKVYTRVKKQFKTLPKMKRLKILSSDPASTKEDDGCVKRIACEIGRENKDHYTKDLVGKLINNMSPKNQRKWKSAIQAYMDGVQSQNGVIVSDSPNPPPPGPVYRHNFCPKYKCSL